MQLITKTRLLKPVVQAIVLARTKPVNVARFYRDRPGLYVYNTFVDWLDLKTWRAMDSAPERPYVALRLKVKASTTDIRNELPETHLSTLEDIADLIEAQSDGKSGLLLNNGNGNIFYIADKNNEVFVVFVCWSSTSRTWDVGIGRVVENGYWPAGRQVLCPGNAAL